jgi:hypothetical protein
VGVIGNVAWLRFGQKSNVGAVFPIASRKPRATFFFPSVSKVITNGLTSNSSKNGWGRALSNACGSNVTIGENSQRENPLMRAVKQVKQVKHAGNF